MRRSTARILAGAAAAACLGAAASDVLLLYHPDGGYLAPGYRFLADLDPSRMVWGHYLGLLLIPLEALGFFHVYHALRPMGARRAGAFVLASVYPFFLGAGYHTTILPAAHALQTGPVELPAAYYHPLGVAIALAIPLFSLVFAALVWRGPTRYRRWMAAANPLSFYLLFVLLYRTLPSAGNVLFPAGWNLAFALFFLSSLGAEETPAGSSRP